ncbi:MAG: nucleotidyl transferase AbiEii/AbiGii toxin family protein [Patescibacteria group bacterium]
MNESIKPKIIEQFHLTFLSALVYRYNPENYVLKGGANIRYYFNSPRYSNDIDLDLIRGDGLKLEKIVDLVLASNVLVSTLNHAGISIVNISKPKQTTTTRRWKLGLILSGTNVEIRTKIEFSGRHSDYHFDRIDIPESIVGQYGITPYILQRYNLDAMIDQKIMALAQRSETKTRDIFDLEILLRVPGSDTHITLLDHENISEALLRSSHLTYENFKEQVIPFIAEDFRAIYSSEQSWERMRKFVINSITKLYNNTNIPRRGNMIKKIKEPKIQKEVK